MMYADDGRQHLPIRSTLSQLTKVDNQTNSTEIMKTASTSIPTRETNISIRRNAHLTTWHAVDLSLAPTKARLDESTAPTTDCTDINSDDTIQTSSTDSNPQSPPIRRRKSKTMKQCHEKPLRNDSKRAVLEQEKLSASSRQKRCKERSVEYPSSSAVQSGECSSDGNQVSTATTLPQLKTALHVQTTSPSLQPSETSNKKPQVSSTNRCRSSLKKVKKTSLDKEKSNPPSLTKSRRVKSRVSQNSGNWPSETQPPTTLPRDDPLAASLDASSSSSTQSSESSNTSYQISNPTRRRSSMKKLHGCTKQVHNKGKKPSHETEKCYTASLVKSRSVKSSEPSKFRATQNSGSRRSSKMQSPIILRKNDQQSTSPDDSSILSRDSSSTSYHISNFTTGRRRTSLKTSSGCERLVANRGKQALPKKNVSMQESTPLPNKDQPSAGPFAKLCDCSSINDKTKCHASSIAKYASAQQPPPVGTAKDEKIQRARSGSKKGRSSPVQSALQNNKQSVTSELAVSSYPPKMKVARDPILSVSKRRPNNLATKKIALNRNQKITKTSKMERGSVHSAPPIDALKRNCKMQQRRCSLKKRASSLPVLASTASKDRRARQAAELPKPHGKNDQPARIQTSTSQARNDNPAPILPPSSDLNHVEPISESFHADGRDDHSSKIFSRPSNAFTPQPAAAAQDAAESDFQGSKSLPPAPEPLPPARRRKSQRRGSKLIDYAAFLTPIESETESNQSEGEAQDQNKNDHDSSRITPSTPAPEAKERQLEHVLQRPRRGPHGCKSSPFLLTDSSEEAIDRKADTSLDRVENNDGHARVLPPPSLREVNDDGPSRVLPPPSLREVSTDGPSQMLPPPSLREVNNDRPSRVLPPPSMQEEKNDRPSRVLPPPSLREANIIPQRRRGRRASTHIPPPNYFDHMRNARPHVAPNPTKRNHNSSPLVPRPHNSRVEILRHEHARRSSSGFKRTTSAPIVSPEEEKKQDDDHNSCATAATRVIANRSIGSAAESCYNENPQTLRPRRGRSTSPGRGRSASPGRDRSSSPHRGSGSTSPRRDSRSNSPGPPPCEMRPLWSWIRGRSSSANQNNYRQASTSRPRLGKQRSLPSLHAQNSSRSMHVRPATSTPYPLEKPSAGSSKSLAV